MSRPRRRTVAVGAVVATAAGLLAAVPSAAAAPIGGSSTSVRYAVVEPACPRATAPDEATCFAMRRVFVPAGTAGARAVEVPQPDALHGPTGGFTPRAINAAYQLNPFGGRGQTVALIDWYDDPHARSDLNHFDAHYGIRKETSTSFRKVNQSGRRNDYPAASTATATEISLDLQAVRTVCRRCTILLVEANNARIDNLARAVNTAVRLGADEISNSYGLPEQPGNRFANAIVQAYQHAHKVITASTGDHGWYGWDYENQGVRPDQGPLYPASNPGVIAVGGTKLLLHANGRRKSEPVWNENGAGDRTGFGQQRARGAAGGGCSFLFGATSYQRAQLDYRRAGCHGHRLGADVSAVADPQTGLDIYNTYGHGGWETIGGTSLSAPLIAAMWALAGGAHGMTRPVKALYQNYRYAPSTLHDVAEGGTGFCGGVNARTCESLVHALAANTDRAGTNNPGYFFDNRYADCSFMTLKKTVGDRPRSRECNAMPGFDGPSGVGSPRNGVRLFRSTTPHAKIAFSGRLRVGHKKEFDARLQDPVAGAHGKLWIWSWGDHTNRTRTHGYAAWHTYHAKGEHKITVRITDSVGQRIVVSRVVTAHRH